jgi:hypothetical protein
MPVQRPEVAGQHCREGAPQRVNEIGSRLANPPTTAAAVTAVPVGLRIRACIRLSR